MNEQDQQIAILEACGWKRALLGGWKHPSGNFVHCSESQLPSYLTDLNACHEMEKALNERCLMPAYISNLKTVCGEPVSEGYSCNTHVTATAAQRCEAFLKTLNLWKE